MDFIRNLELYNEHGMEVVVVYKEEERREKSRNS
jgi:hypothetical protein